MQTDERQEDSPPDDSSTYRSEEWQVRLSGEPRRGKKVSKGERSAVSGTTNGLAKGGQRAKQPIYQGGGVGAVVTTVLAEQWGQMPNGVPKTMDRAGRQGDCSEARKESRDVEQWLERITGTARDSKTGTVTSPFNDDGDGPPHFLHSTT